MLEETILECPSIDLIKETHATDRVGKWHFIATLEKKEDAEGLIDTKLPIHFINLVMDDLENIRFEFFPTLCHGNQPQSKTRT